MRDITVRRTISGERSKEATRTRTKVGGGEKRRRKTRRRLSRKGSRDHLVCRAARQHAALSELLLKPAFLTNTKLMRRVNIRGVRWMARIPASCGRTIPFQKLPSYSLTRAFRSAPLLHLLLLLLHPLPSRPPPAAPAYCFRARTHMSPNILRKG